MTCMFLNIIVFKETYKFFKSGDNSHKKRFILSQEK